ncbi:hypothetical protein [Neorhizobium sp. AL 9.2.2]|uniref:hypothetical protein n=1 Tax=Neorhizobium sp. AL 9.2.2 TaxID=2712894 RepID=UPI00157280E8|nr:hypothetical protein [Neorhizobium sp. AL 9.2.2]NSY19988.1 hypothetical protein [Neorhizobium sp. AL 9.2.2]
MFLADLIVALGDIDGSNRKLDAEIARAVGWTKKMERRRDKSDGNVIEIGVWYRPDGSEARKVPFFTESVQSAYEFVRGLDQDMVAACSFGPEGAKAHVEGQTPIYARTLPVVLCIAGLKTIEKQMGQTGLDR